MIGEDLLPCELYRIDNVVYAFFYKIAMTGWKIMTC